MSKNFHDLLKERVEREGPAVAKKWGANLRRNKFKLNLRKQEIYEGHLENGFRLKNRYETRRTKSGDEK